MVSVSGDCFPALSMPSPACPWFDSPAAECAQSPPPRPSPVEGEGETYAGRTEFPPPPLRGRVGVGGVIELGSSDLARPGDQAFGGGAGLRRHRAAREHARDLLAALADAQLLDPGRSLVRRLFLGDPPMMHADRRDLRGMGYDQHLEPLAEPVEPLADRCGDGAADAAVDLV